MTTEEMFAELMKRQEAHMALGHALCDRVESLSDQVAELMAWANQPADTGMQDSIDGLTEALRAAKPEDKGDIGEWIRGVAGALAALQDHAVRHGGMLQQMRQELPAEIARAMTTGEV